MPGNSGIYLHIPFCLSKCAYCDFCSRPLSDDSEMERYLRALKQEIKLRARGRAGTVYFGGGTPSLCSPEQIEDLLRVLTREVLLEADAEITLEANPATADLARLTKFRQLGINRLSLGVQSTSERYLSLLGRIHSADQARQLIHSARQAGFDNLSCDLIYGLPGQTLSEFEADLKNLVSWEPDHLSLYALSVESGTKLSLEIASGLLPAPEDDLAADMYAWSRNYLFEQGFSQYELSNFCRPGRECRHNLIYWTDRPYLGLGVAAHSYERGRRSWNVSEEEDYCRSLENKKKPQAGSEKLKGKRKIAEDLIVGLRLSAGVQKKVFAERFGGEWQEAFKPAIQKLRQSGLLDESRESLCLTSQGMLLANLVFRELL